MVKRDGAHKSNAQRGGQALAVLGLLLALIVLVAGAVLLTTSPNQEPGVDPHPPRPTLDSGADNAAAPAGPVGPAPELPPDTLSLGPLGVTAEILDATVPNGVLTPPHDVTQVGKWVDGAPLGSDAGTVLLAGHVNMSGQGNGALFNLALLRPGDLIHTSDEEGKVTSWQVSRVVNRPKSDGIEESVLNGPSGPRRLAVVTCGGDLEFSDGIGDYEDNVYLYADPVHE